MTIHHCTPFDRAKDLGRAYNQTFRKVKNEDWVCLRDIDTMFLTPDAPNIIEDYVLSNQDCGLLTCYTNRISLASSEQLLNGQLSEEPSITHHIRIAEDLSKMPKTATELTGHVSGLLMVISKRVWRQVKFPETGQCLGVDSAYCEALRAAGLSILRMNSLYIFHQYRITKGINYREHLKV